MRIRYSVMVAAALALTSPLAAAQSVDAQAKPPAVTEDSVRPYVTLRFFAGPAINLMGDWRDGIETLADLASARGLQPHEQCCIGKSWGATALVHVTRRIALGATVEALRDTRAFRVTDSINAFGIHSDGEFGFENETEVQARQVAVAIYPSSGTHTHAEFAGGFARGHSELSTPGSSSYARLHAPTLSISAGTETRFWYVEAGWRFLRMHPSDRTVNDFDIGEARDVFADAPAVQQFVNGRDTDLSGLWARMGIALHLGRR